MPKSTTTFILAFISLGSFAQKTGLTLEKLGLKNLQQHLRYIPAKSFNSLVYTGKDSVSTYGPRTSSVQGFYISQTEVTNKEYREFVHYVRDSIAHGLLQHFRNGSNTIDWAHKIDWKDDRLDALMIPPDERIFGRKDINAGKIIFELDFFGQQENISIYPDTLVWIRDFSYSYNEPLAKKYFAYPFYNDYPVVGVSLKQAMAFCQWKTDKVNAEHPAEKPAKGKPASTIEVMVQLPTNAEWESAAIEDKDSLALFAKNKEYNCNFGMIADRNGFAIKDFKDDGYFYTGPVKSFPPGPYGLYDMRGNIAEWTATSRDEIMNVEMKPEKSRSSFIVKGGGWNSTPFYLQAGVCQFFTVDAAHSFVGFRYVVYVIKK